MGLSGAALPSLLFLLSLALNSVSGSRLLLRKARGAEIAAESPATQDEGGDNDDVRTWVHYFNRVARGDLAMVRLRRAYRLVDDPESRQAGDPLDMETAVGARNRKNGGREAGRSIRMIRLKKKWDDEDQGGLDDFWTLRHLSRLRRGYGAPDEGEATAPLLALGGEDGGGRRTQFLRLSRSSGGGDGGTMPLVRLKKWEEVPQI